MDKFDKLTSAAAPLNMINVDTDMVIPKQFLKTIARTGLGKNLFHEMRYDDDGNEVKDFVLNQPAYRNAKILVADENFGCGSSREHAPWALLDSGITCIIAPSFADIFYNNCFKNGILPIRVSKDELDALMADASDPENPELTIDLEEMLIRRPNGAAISFKLEEFRRDCLLDGLDDIGITMKKEKSIGTFEEKQRLNQPWLYPAAAE